MFTSTLTPQIYQKLMNIQYSRRLLLNGLIHQTTPPVNHPMDPMEPYRSTNANGFETNVIMVLSVLLCAVICSLALNFIVKCALRCSSLEPTESENDDLATRLANTGIKKKALKSFAVVSYSPDLKLPGLDSECVICLSEFGLGDKLRLLPRCNHGFHTKCIDTWLNSHSSCPSCRNCLIEMCQKIVGCDQGSSSQPAPQMPQEAVINITPLEREDLVRNYRCNGTNDS